MKKLITALATAGLLAGVFGFAAPRTAEASGVIWVSMKGTPVIDANNLEYSSFEASMGYGPYEDNYTRAGYDCLHPDYNDIQLAVDNSVDNDTIYICPGLWKMQTGWQYNHDEYWEAAVYASNPISNDATTGLRFVGAGMNKTIIDGLRGGNKLDVAFDLWGNDDGSQDATFSQLTIRNFGGLAVYGAEITCDAAAFRNNGGKAWDGAAIRADLNVSTSGCLFVGNAGGQGGAIRWSEDVPDAIWTDHGSTFIGNNSYADGGAAYGNAAELHDTVFTGNFAKFGVGGAIATWNCTGSTFDHITATKNSASDDGGAIYIGGDWCDDDSVTITSSVFKNNSSGDLGGAVAAYDADVYLTGSVFQQNRAADDGGAVYGYDVYFSGNRFIGNISGDCGGAVYFQDDIYTPEANFYRGNRDTYGDPNWC